MPTAHYICPNKSLGKVIEVRDTNVVIRMPIEQAKAFLENLRLAVRDAVEDDN